VVGKIAANGRGYKIVAVFLAFPITKKNNQLFGLFVFFFFLSRVEEKKFLNFLITK
jgi:hypothetical protein